MTNFHYSKEIRKHKKQRTTEVSRRPLFFGVGWLIFTVVIPFLVSHLFPLVLHLDFVPSWLTWLTWLISWLISSPLPSAEILRGWGLYLAGVGIAPLVLYLTYDRTDSIRVQKDNEKEKNVTSAFTQSVELLSSDSIATKQGGIYSLGRIARDNPEFHATILKIMTSYVRDESYNKFYKIFNEKQENEKKRLIDEFTQEPMPIDIEAAIEMIIRREEKYDDSEGARKRREFFLDLSNIFIFNGTFNDTNLCDSKFSDSKMLSCSFIEVRFSGSFFKAADLRNSSFESCHFDNCDFQNCNLTNVEFKKCNLKKAKGLSQRQIEKAIVVETDLPEETKIHSKGNYISQILNKFKKN